MSTTTEFNTAAPSHSGGELDLPVAVDAMGGDFGFPTVVAGAVEAAAAGHKVLLVGDPDQLGTDHGLPVLPASQVIPMDADPARAVRAMKDSSMVRAAEAVRDGKASAVWSAGSTGATMAASLLRLGRIKGVSRPAVAVPLPVWDSTPMTLLDCGANAECQPEWLVQFAMMGTAYTRIRYGIDRPRVAVLTIGEEAGKGNALVKEACELLEDAEWATRCGADFVGNIEGQDLMTTAADVVVCDGFTGNVTLKTLEGAYGMAFEAARRALKASPTFSGLGSEIEATIDPIDEFFSTRAAGAAMLLGTKGVSMISHGAADQRTIARAIGTAADMVSSGVVPGLREVLGSPALQR